MTKDRQGDGVTGGGGDKSADTTSPRLRVSASNFTDLLGRPFKYGGRGPEEYDCYGLCMEIYRRRGLALPEFGTSPSSPIIDGMVRRGRESFIKIEKPEPFCLVTFMIRPPYTSHVGVVLEDCVRFIHIFRSTRVCIERLDMQHWGWRTTGFYKLP